MSDLKRAILAIALLLCNVALGQLKLKGPLPQSGRSLPMVDHLSAAAGMVDVAFTLPDGWPNEVDQTLFHVGDRAHVHVTVFFRKGALVAVYKGGEAHHAAINTVTARQWKPGSRHVVQFLWRAEGARVPFYLRVDGRLAGNGEGRLIETWPDRFAIGVRGKNSPWRGTIERVEIIPDPPPLPELRPGQRTITIDAANVVGSIYNFWSIANYTREDMFTDDRLRAQQTSQRPFMKYVNCVRLLGGREDGRNRWYLGLDENGEPRFDFTGLVACLRGMLAWGYTPRIVLDNVPTEMSGDVELHQYGNTYPPKDYAVWEAFVEGAVRAMVEAFGIATVSSWRFRVGTEPDLDPGHWAGTQAEYYHHYARTVAAVRKVIPEPDIGPGNILSPTHGKWGLELVDHIATNGLPMEYFSSSWYGRVGQPQDSFETIVKLMRERLDRYEQFRGIPIEIAEFAILQDEHNRRLWCGDTTEWGASWYAAIAEKVYRLNVAQVHQWATTTAGLHHPRVHVHTMLEKMMGGRRLAVEAAADSHANAGAIAARRDGKLYVLLYNHRPLRAPSVPEAVCLQICDPRMKANDLWQLSEWRVDRSHGVFIHALYEDCQNAGQKPLENSPLYGGNIHLRWGREGQALLHKNRERYAGLAALPKTKTDEAVAVQDGAVTLNLALPGHSVRLLELVQSPRE